MIKSKLEEFLNKRDSRITTIETANILYQMMGNKNFTDHENHLDLDNFEIGCITQYFAFTQKTLVDFMFMNFITVIGQYDSKKDSLKSWNNINFSDENEKNFTLTRLKEVRSRYSEARNNFICHISDEEKSIPNGVSTKQINDDISTLREIFNIIRRNNNIPIVVMGYHPSKAYSVIGLKKIISILKNEEVDLVQ